MPQTKNEIAKALYKQGIRASATKVGEVAIALNLGDKLDYSDDEATAIILDFQTKPESQPQQEPHQPDSQPQIPFDRDAAKSLVHRLQAETQADQHALVEQAVNGLNRAADARCRILDMLSDRKAYLTDPIMFWAELEQLTAQKRLKLFQPDSPDLEVIDLASTFDSALTTWKYPAIRSETHSCNLVSRLA